MDCLGRFDRWDMNKIDRLLKMAANIQAAPGWEYDYSRLTTEELRELLQDDITDERITKIMEPVKREVWHE